MNYLQFKCGHDFISAVCAVILSIISTERLLYINSVISPTSAVLLQFVFEHLVEDILCFRVLL